MPFSVLRAKVKVFRLVLASYILLLLLPLLLGTVLLRSVVRAVRDEAIRANQRAVMKGQSVADDELRSLDAFVIEIARSQKVYALLSVDSVLEGTGISRVVDAWLDLAKLRMPGLVQDVFLHFNRSGVVISPGASYIRMDYFDTRFFDSEGRSFTQWKDALFTGTFERRWFPAQTIGFLGQQSTVLTLVRSLPLGASEDAQGAAIVFVRQAALEDLLSPAGEEAGTRVLVVDGAGRPIAGDTRESWASHAVSSIGNASPPGSPEPVRIGDRWLFSAASKYNDWTYVLSLPDAVVMARVRSVRNSVLVGLALFSVLGIAAATALAKWQSRPIREIVRALGENLRASGSQGNEYDQVRATVLHLLDGNRDLAMALQRQAPLVRHSFLRRIVKGELADRGEVRALAAQAGVDLGGPRFLVLVAVFPVQGELTQEDLAVLNVTRAAHVAAAERRLPSRSYVVETDVDEFSMILSIGSAAKEAGDGAVRGHAQELALGLHGLRESQAAGGLRGPVLAAGTVVEDPMGICISYANARTAARLRCREEDGNRDLVFYDDLPRDSASYYYPLGMENRIVALAHQGDAAAIEELLATVWRENFERRRLSAQAVKELAGEMRATIAKAAEDAAGQDSGGGLRRMEGTWGTADAQLPQDPRELLGRLTAMYRSLCTAVVDRRRSHSRRLREDIFAHISSTYVDPNLCLQSIATHFRLSPFYVSKFFKEQAGENFHQYLERLRLDAACQLLRDTELPIAEVARKTGYADLSTFRKAFRRVLGASPRDVRQGAAGYAGSPGRPG